MNAELTKRARETGEGDFDIGVDKHNQLYVVDKETGLHVTTDVNQMVEGMAAALRKMVAPAKRELQIQTARAEIARMETDLADARTSLMYLEKAAEE